jgi:epoxyqueuosine reductase
MPALTAHEVKAEALLLGFDACYITPAGESPHYDSFEQWILEGKHGQMDWLAREPERRKNTGNLLPECRSVILTGTNYFQTAPPQRGKIATYALGQDYHDLLGERLRTLCSWMESRAGGRHRPFVDTSAVMEKPLAMQAGLGWQGKNTMLIHRRMGNWLSLGGILSSLELSEDKPETDHCGSCHRCIDACPTGAITAPYQLDARRCIAYLTIEHKGPIPLEYRKAIGDRLFGCDDCLSICPWNRWAQESREAHFQPIPRPELREMLQWDDATFRKHYRGSPIFRLKHPRWLRNICVVLGNIGTGEDLPSLQTLAGHTDPLIQEHALWAIGEIRLREEPRQVVLTT